MIFSKKKPKIGNLNFTIGDSNIEIVNNFKYLGVTFTYNGSFNNHIKAQRVLGNGAMFSVMNKIRRYNLPIDLQLDLFDKIIMPIILDGCEAWGVSNLTI